MDRLSDYDYELPPDRIAQLPLDDRASSKLLHLDKKTGEIHHRHFRDIVGLLEKDDLLVLNDTRVTALRLFGQKQTGGKVELLLLKEIEEGLYEALVKPGRRLKPGATFELDGFQATVERDLEKPKKAVRIEASMAELTELGQTPLPPYIHEKLANPERYQTVYSKVGGSAAAPTAGLHFTQELLDELAKNGVLTVKVTLDVSLDTFRPVEKENLEQHMMHGEWAEVPVETAEKIANVKGKIIGVGTTVVRTLESFATDRRQIEPGRKLTKLFIRPGFDFKVVDGMLTNFHMPRTTMLVLISALAGRDKVFHAYEEALRQGYRFLSFGDSMLIL